MVTHWPPQTPMDPTHMIGGRRQVGGALGEERVSLALRFCPHVLHGGTSADVDGILIIVASFFCVFRRRFYPRGLHELQFRLRSCMRKWYPRATMLPAPWRCGIIIENSSPQGLILMMMVLRKNQQKRGEIVGAFGFPSAPLVLTDFLCTSVSTEVYQF